MMMMLRMILKLRMIMMSSRDEQLSRGRGASTVMVKGLVWHKMNFPKTPVVISIFEESNIARYTFLIPCVKQ
jgi:hypothetical protein